MSDILKSLGKNLSNSINSDDLDLNKNKNIPKPDKSMDIFKDMYGNINIGYDSYYMDFLMKQQIPVDAWTFTNWKVFFKDLYQSVFNRPCIFTNKQFNIVFCEIFDEARNIYELSNEEIHNYFVWCSQTYMQYILKHEKPFYIRNLKYKLPDYYEREVSAIAEREKLLGEKIRDYPIDRSDLKLSIDKYFEEDLSILIKQLGFLNMLHYTQKFICDGNIREAYTILVRSIDKRLKFEEKYSPSMSSDSYINKLIENTIYFGPYPFEEKLLEAGIPTWRETFGSFIVSTNLHKKDWWMDVYLERKPLDCVDKLGKKRKTAKKKDKPIL